MISCQSSLNLFSTKGFHFSTPFAKAFTKFSPQIDWSIAKGQSFVGELTQSMSFTLCATDDTLSTTLLIFSLIPFAKLCTKLLHRCPAWFASLDNQPVTNVTTVPIHHCITHSIACVAHHTILFSHSHAQAQSPCNTLPIVWKIHAIMFRLHSITQPIKVIQPLTIVQITLKVVVTTVFIPKKLLSRAFFSTSSDFAVNLNAHSRKVVKEPIIALISFQNLSSTIFATFVNASDTFSSVGLIFQGKLFTKSANHHKFFS